MIKEADRSTELEKRYINSTEMTNLMKEFMSSKIIDDVVEDFKSEGIEEVDLKFGITFGITMATLYLLGNAKYYTFEE